MFGNIVYLVLGFILGFLVAVIIRSGGRAELDAEIGALEGQNRVLRDRLFEEQTMGEGKKEPEDD